MPERTFRRRRRWALALSLVLFALMSASLLAATTLIWRTVRAQQTERLLAERTDAVLTTLGKIGRAAVDAESGQRGHFITLDGRYLAPYELGRQSVPAHLQRLRALLADRPDPRTTALLAQVEARTRERFAELDRSVALVAQGRILEAQQAILSDEGQQLMAGLRASLGELERLERARLAVSTRETATLEARLLPLLAGLAAVIATALVLGLWLLVRSARAAEQAAQAAELAAARDRADLLARELNHRVKNLFAVVLAIVRMSGRDAPEAKGAIDGLANRIHALARAHDLTQGGDGEAEIDLRQLIQTATAPYCSANERCEIEGPATSLPGTMAMPLGLMLHELATNAVKYGAWAKRGGLIRVDWQQPDGELLLRWREHGDIQPRLEKGRGFGSQLIESATRQLQGRIEHDWAGDGLDLKMRLPLTRPD